MSIAAFMYSQLPTKSVGEITEIIRVSETAYTVRGSGVLSFFKKNIDTGDVEQLQHDFSQGDYTLNHSQGQRFEVSADGVNWKSAWGVYLNGEDAYLEALNIEEQFLNDASNLYRKINFFSESITKVNVFGNTFLPSSRNSRAELLTTYGIEPYDIYLMFDGGGYRPMGISDLRIVNEFKLEQVSGRVFLYVDGVEKESWNERILIEAEKEAQNYFIGKGAVGRNVQGFWKTTLFNIELGVHKAQMNGQGTQLVDQNGEPFLNFKGGAEWVKI